MDLTQQALQTNGKLFSNIGIIFRISYNFYNKSDVILFLVLQLNVMQLHEFDLDLAIGIYLGYIYTI